MIILSLTWRPLLIFDTIPRIFIKEMASVHWALIRHSALWQVLGVSHWVSHNSPEQHPPVQLGSVLTYSTPKFSYTLKFPCTALGHTYAMIIYRLSWLCFFHSAVISRETEVVSVLSTAEFCEPSWLSSTCARIHTHTVFSRNTLEWTKKGRNEELGGSRMSLKAHYYLRKQGQY